MENNKKTIVEPNENPDEDFLDELEDILTQLDSVLIEAHLSCDHILSNLIPIDIEEREPLIEVHSDAMIAKEEPSEDAAKIIEIEESTGAVVGELPIAADAGNVLDIPRSLPEFDDYMWKCNECQIFTIGLGVGFVVLCFIIFLAFLKQVVDGRFN